MSSGRGVLQLKNSKITEHTRPSKFLPTNVLRTNSCSHYSFLFPAEHLLRIPPTDVFRRFSPTNVLMMTSLPRSSVCFFLWMPFRGFSQPITFRNFSHPVVLRGPPVRGCPISFRASNLPRFWPTYNLPINLPTNVLSVTSCSRLSDFVFLTTTF